MQLVLEHLQIYPLQLIYLFQRDVWEYFGEVHVLERFIVPNLKFCEDQINTLEAMTRAMKVNLRQFI